MNKKLLHAQRVHVLYSLERVLHILHTLSYLLTPSLWLLFVRTVTISSEPHPKLSLRFWFALVGIANLTTIHGLLSGVLWKVEIGDGYGAVLDFIGNDPRPSRLYISLLDIAIFFLQLLNAFIAYEARLMFTPHSSSTPTTLSSLAPDEDPLLPSSPSISPDSDLEASMLQKTDAQGKLIMDVRWHNIWRRLRYPPTIHSPAHDGEGQTDPGPVSALSIPHPLVDGTFHILPFAPTPPPVERINMRLPGSLDRS